MSASIMASGDVKPASSNSGTASAKLKTKGVEAGSKKPQPSPQGAWGKGNPLSSKPSYPNVANGSASKPTPPTQQTKGLNGANADKHAHDRLVFLLSQCVGTDVVITLRSGEQFAGVFSGLSLDSKQQYIIKMARRIRAGHQQVNGNTDAASEYTGEGADYSMTFDMQDTVDFDVRNVAITAGTSSKQNGAIGSSFLTDTQISGRDPHVPRERELQRWDAGADTDADLSLEAAGDTSWDQFATNERMYGVQSTYDEDIYTTSIDRSNPAYRRREAEAERIAREIEGSAPANAHVAEERRRDAHRDDAGDEEDKYSGVRRETALPQRNPNAYVPPSRRPITGTPSVPGAPFDPAIISSQIRTPSTAQQQASDAPKAAPPPAVDVPVPSAFASDLSKKKENTTEDRVRDTADAFRHFANTEKLRIRQAQEAKRVNMRQEKNVKLNDLKKFAANFKLKSRVPDDLVPILAKDREKQIEIQSKADIAAKEEEQRAKEKDSEKASTLASPAPSSSVSQVVPAVIPDSRTPYNQNSLNQSNLNQHNQLRGSQPMRGGHAPGGSTAPRGSLTNRIYNNNPQMFRNRPGMPQPLPADLRIPSGPLAPSTERPMSPNSATRLNVNAKSFEFRPGASAFTPTGTTPSPQRAASGVGPSATEQTSTFFDKKKMKETKPFPTATAYDSLHRMAAADYTDQQKLHYTKNGGIPQAYNTAPTWSAGKGLDNTSHTAAFPKAQAPSQGPSPMHTPNPSQLPHSHQLPAHMQTPSMPVPNPRPQFYGQPQHGHAPSFDPRLQQHFGPNGSVQSSPRTQQVPVAPFNGQMQQMPMPPFPGQPIPGYGMSPSMQYRQMAPQGTPMMIPGQPQPGQMMPMRPGFPGGPQFGGPQQMGGHMMVQNPSQGYVNGPMPQQGFSPMPPHAQPHMPHMQQHGPGSFNGSPRPPMMSHQGSHQGFQPGMMQPHFAPAPAGQPHPYHMSQRAMSGGYPQMTPRQQAAVPHHPSPGMGVAAPGDEGK